MNQIALGMVLASAFLHSAWNYMAKRSSDKLIFLWLASGAGLIIFAPAFTFSMMVNTIERSAWLLIACSSLVHVLYYVLLAGAYSRTDLTIAYPLARGTGPLFVLVLSFMFLQQTPSLMGTIGIVAIVAGVYMVQARQLTLHDMGEAVRSPLLSGRKQALLTGLTIGLYSIIDSVGVQQAHPIIYMYLWVAGTFFLMAPWMVVRWRAVLHVVRSELGWIVGAGAFLFGAYLLVLSAMLLSPVSYVSAAREISVVLALIYGAGVLKERVGLPRFAGASLVASGLILIGIAG